MFKIHTNDGITSRIDLSDADQAREWLERLGKSSFQKTITGMSVLRKCNGVFRCSSCNKKFRHITCPACGRQENEAHCRTGVQYSLSKPIDFRDQFYYPERIEPNHEAHIRGGERIVCFVDGVRIVMMAHANQSAVRFSLAKVGKQMYNPYDNGIHDG